MVDLWSAGFRTRVQNTFLFASYSNNSYLRLRSCLRTAAWVLVFALSDLRAIIYLLGVILYIYF